MKANLSITLLVSISCSLVTKAKEASNKVEILPARLAIIAIGPKPPRRFSNTGSTILPPKQGEIPPRRLYFEAARKEDEKQVLKSINVTFNNPSHFINVPPNQALNLLLRRKNEYSTHLNIAPLEAGSMTLIFLRPNGAGDRRWVKEPLKYKINILSDTFKNKKVALLNLSRREVKSIFHEDQQILEAGELLSYESIEGLDLHRIAAAYGRENKMIYNTAMRLNESNQLILYVLYDANPHTNDGRTVGSLRVSVNPNQLKNPKDPISEEGNLELK